MAGSSVTSPRKSGSIRRLTDIANPPNRPDSPEMPRGPMSNPGPNRAVAPGSDTKPANIAGIKNTGINRNYEYGQVAGSYREPGSTANFYQTTPTPVDGASLGPALTGVQRAARRPQGSGAVSTGGMNAQNTPHRAGDRTGVAVVGADGTPIRVDNNQRIAGQASAKQEQEIRTLDPNSANYNREKDPRGYESETYSMNTKISELAKKMLDPNLSDEERAQARVDLIAEESRLKDFLKEHPNAAGTSSEQGALFKPGIDAQAKAGGAKWHAEHYVPDDTKSPEEQKAYDLQRAQALLRWALERGDTATAKIAQDKINDLSGTGGGSEIGTSAAGLTGNTPSKPVTTQPGATQPGATQPGATQPGATQPSAGYKPGSFDYGTAAKPSAPPLSTTTRNYDEDGEGPSTLSYDFISMETGWSSEAVQAHIDAGGTFQYDGDELQVISPEGESFEDVRGNAYVEQMGNTYQKRIDEGRAGITETDLNVQSEEDFKTLENQIKTSVDWNAFDKHFDNAQAKIQAANARNKALALRANQERAAYSGMSVNQTMGINTEAGYDYDVEEQKEIAAAELARASNKLAIEMQQANQLIELYRARWEKSTNQAEKAALARQMNVMNNEQYHRQLQQWKYQEEANSPGVGMTLAKIGIGVAGAAGALFTGGASMAGAIGAIGAMGAAAGSIASDYNGGGAPMPDPTQFMYKGTTPTPAPGTPYTFQTGYAPGQLNLGVPRLTLGAI